MKIDEFIEKVNDSDAMQAREADKKIFIGIPSNMGILFIPEYATNFMEIDMSETSIRMYWGKPDREYLSSLIEELLHTPVKERFPEKKYRLVANPDSFDQTGTNVIKYVARIEESMDSFSFVYGGPTVFLERDLKDIEKRYPNIAPAIEAMKEEAKDDEEQD